MIKLLKLLKPFKYYAIMSIILVVFSNIMQLVLPALMASMVNNGIMLGDTDFIKKTGAIMLIVAFFGMGISIFNSYCTSRTSSGYGMLLRKEMFLKVESLSQSDIDKIGVPSLITRTSNDIRHIQSVVLNGLKMIIAVPVLFVGGLFMSIRMNPTLSKILFAVVPIVAIIALLIVKFLIPKFKLMQEKTDQLNQVVREKISGIRVIRAFNRTSYEDSRFAKSNLELTDIALKIQRTMAALMPVGIIAIYGLMAMLLWFSSTRIEGLDAAIPEQASRINSTIGDMQAFIVYIGLVIYALTMAAAMFVEIPRAQISAKRINEVLNMVPEIVETQTPCDTCDSAQKGVLEFRNVSFAYKGSENPTLKNVSFISRPGEITAIIGSTGSGKTTLINLIPRLYDVNEGAILIDGIDIKNMTFDELHSKLAFIPQKAFLFSGTVEDNLRFGKEDASDDEIYKALELAQAKTFVERLPNKTQDLISQSGTNLSGGQKQRLAIARALIKNADICIFDDSFSALDLSTDARLRAAIRQNLQTTNIIIVAQRVGTIIDADRIILMNEGEISAIGTHEELLESSEIYKDIVKSQLSDEEVSAC